MKKSFATQILICLASLWLLSCGKPPQPGPGDLKNVRTLAGFNREFGEPFGVAVKNDVVYVSDGQNGKILTASQAGAVTTFVGGLDTPSGIAFDKNGDLFVADSGSSSIKKIDAEEGKVVTFAGVDGQAGDADGGSGAATFRGPIGIAVADDGTVYVADTYNDRIRVIRNGTVITLAGSSRGFVDGAGGLAKFNTPCGLALTKDGNLLVADLGNRRIRIVQRDGTTSTLVGTGNGERKDGMLDSANVYSPTAVAVDQNGSIFIADGNSIRVIRPGTFPYLQTISGRRGLADGSRRVARFNRPSGLAIDSKENVFIADSDNRLLRTLSSGEIGKVISTDDIQKLRFSAEEFRTLAPARWPYDPPNSKREVAGTMGELRGEIKPGNEDIHYHNGLDIAGGYGETARFVRDEKVLDPLAVANFGTLRELIRMPTMGYIHMRLGRDKDEKPFGDKRFLFDGIGKPTDVRVSRGTRFRAGEPIGTLNPMNHVHLIAGPSGYEMNALDALILPGISDTIAPTIEKVSLFDENWSEIETGPGNSRIKLSGKIRVVVRAYDRMDGNAERRRLGVFSVGYSVYKATGGTVTDRRDDIDFKRLPDDRSVPFVYALGSKSGATGETIFNYIATNDVNADSFKEDLLDVSGYEPGQYSLKVFVSDYFGNTATKDISFEVTK